MKKQRPATWKVNRNKSLFCSLCLSIYPVLFMPVCMSLYSGCLLPVCFVYFSCLSIYLLFPHAGPFVYLSIYPAYMLIRLSVYLSTPLACWSVCPFIYLPGLYAGPFVVYLSISLSIYSVCMLARLSVCLCLSR